MKPKLLVLLLGLTFFLKLPSLFEPPWYGDEGIYLTIGQNINRGYVLYRDITDNKPPLIYYLASLCPNQFVFRLVFFLVGLTTIFLFAKVSKSPLATLIFLLLTQTTILEGNIPNGENLMLLPVLVGLYWITSQKHTSSRYFFLVGLISGFAPLAKLTSVFDLFALFFLVNFKFPKLKFSSYFFLLGAVTPFFFTAFFFWFHHLFTYFQSAVITNNFGYIGSWYTGNHTKLYLSSKLVVKGLFAIVVLSSFFFYLKNHKKKVSTFFPIIWLVLAYIGASLSGRPYAHYFIQIAAPLSLLSSQILSKLPKNIVTIFFVSFCFYIFGKTKGYYLNFLSGNQVDNYDNRVSSIETISNHLRQVTPNKSYLFTWTDEPYFYYLSNRLPAFPYILRYHVDDRQQRLPLISAIQNHSAAVVTSIYYPPYPELQTLLDHYYQLDYAYGPYNLYLLR